MKYTSEMLMKAMGLSVGDRIKVKFDVCSLYYKDTGECEVIKDVTGIIMLKNKLGHTTFISDLLWDRITLRSKE